MLRQTLPWQPPGEASITIALRSGVKPRNSTTCEPGLSSASPGSRSQALANSLVIEGIAEVAKCDDRPQVALTKDEQSTPTTSKRTLFLVQTLPASAPFSTRATNCASDPWQPQQYGTLRTTSSFLPMRYIGRRMRL